ncbi:hypothetical protein [Pelagibacterium lacus]|uniref:Uncharacterized protein n=1 Tax=Pelagibacterium lacus TaxID=2282655 RepID=A0A369W4V1_9HYPH|nr:hypothetical protein [Pelagibacterium lacus]RDE08380.1 hypothetical protein DVH29_11660 [Pelagibacterium lacus]
MKRRDALKGLTLLGFLSAGAPVQAHEVVPAISEPEISPELRKLSKALELMKLFEKADDKNHLEMIADLREKGNEGVARSFEDYRRTLIGGRGIA